MKIPAPQDRLADCVWLPRLLAKARMLQRGDLPAAYAERFCHPTGVDSLFLQYFHLRREDILAAALQPDDAVVEWFCTRPESSAAHIAKWNHLALNLGRPGYPMAERFSIALATVYQHLDTTGMTTVFEVLEADDALSSQSDTGN